ncbi:hypothetical protein [Terasakiella brassicae]|uniref:hypothetical protein n=1 Tax=Terasakiella brassicae TaxID=1634917 RepID=UPI00166D3198|nr:hypothetical protein [Terasakiella brassicae]
MTSETGSFTNAYGKVQATDTLSISAQEFGGQGVQGVRGTVTDLSVLVRAF